MADSPRLSQLPAAASALRLANQLLEADQLGFVEVLRNAGLARELEGEELLRVATLLGDASSDVAKRIDLLEAYYAAGGDDAGARRRRKQDRFIAQHLHSATTAFEVVARLDELAPELAPMQIVRIGTTDAGPLVLRAGDHVAALLDEHEESLDTDELDLRGFDPNAREESVMLTIRALVGATNALLDRHGVRERLIALRSDEAREVYVATSVTEAVELARGGWLEDDVEEVIELGAW